MKPGQFVPNWNDMVMPDTTPIAKLSAKTFTQNRYAAIHFASPVWAKRTRKKNSTQPSAIVIVGNRMWNEMLAANWIRLSRRVSSASIRLRPYLLTCVS